MRIQSTVGGAAFALAAAIVASATGSASASQRSNGRIVTYSRDIRPILQSHCTICHAPRGPAPMPLVTYADALKWATRIKEQTLLGRMPVWHAARGYGAFANDPTLSPFERAAIVEWVDGERLPGEAQRPVAAPPQGLGGTIPAGALAALVPVRGGWATGWEFYPGDPLITLATFTSDDGSVIGTWTAGDRAVRLPDGAAVRVVSPVTVEIWRRRPTAYETAVTPRRSALRFLWWVPSATRPQRLPARRVWTEHLACGASLGPAQSSIIGVRPLLAPGANAQITVERVGGAQSELLGWFREFDPAYARIYWLQEPIDFAANARLTSDAPCDLEVLLTGRRLQTAPSRRGQRAALPAPACTAPCAERSARTECADRDGCRLAADAVHPSDPRTPRRDAPARHDTPPDR